MALVDDREIRLVHREFLGKDSATDVISFRYGPEGKGGPAPAGRKGGPPGEPFGELVISAETARREARARGIPARTELLRYAIHGLLHLLGEDDASSSGRRRMRALERRYLERLSPGS